MQISDKRLREYQEAYRKDFGEDITIEEAREQLFRLVTLYELIAQPFPERQEKAEDESAFTPPSGHPL